MAVVSDVYLEPAAIQNRLVELLQLTAKGDQSAFTHLYQLTSAKLYGITLRMLRNRTVADEVLQEAYIRVWHKAGAYDPAKGDPFGWLVVLLRRCALDRLRQQGRDPLGSAHNEPAENSLREQLSVPVLDGAVEDVRDCVNQLELRQREAILLAYYYGLTHDEISSQLKSPLGTVKSWVRRGLQRLKDCLDR